MRNFASAIKSSRFFNYNVFLYTVFFQNRTKKQDVYDFSALFFFLKTLTYLAIKPFNFARLIKFS